MKEGRGLNNRGRYTLLVLSGLFVLLFSGVAYSFVRLAVTGHARGYNLWAMAFSQNVRGVEETARRGSIFDRYGEDLAIQVPSFTIFANKNPNHGGIGFVEDVPKTAAALSTVLNLSQERLVELLSADRSRVEFGSAGRNLTHRERQRIDELELPGIGFDETSHRFYPNGVFASHTIGYAQLVEGTQSFIGKMGLEQAFDEELSGIDGRSLFVNDSQGRLQPHREMVSTRDVQHGQNIYLTLDASIQIFLERALDEEWELSEPESIVAIVADPSTGAILAMGSRSTFDPNIRDIEDFNNRVLYAFEPGSTMKVWTYAAAINEGVYVPDALVHSGSRSVPGATVRDSDHIPANTIMTFDEAFYRSSNTAIVDLLMERIKPEVVMSYFQEFGFGSMTGLPLTGEQAGSVPANRELLQQINAGFGQGLLTTPIQQIQGMTAILNEGRLLRPQLVSRIFDPNTEQIISQMEVEEIGQPITAATAEQVKQLMIGAVENPVSTGHTLYRLDQVEAGGKTGTGQVWDTESNSYIRDKWLFNFVGFAPADDPQLVMYIAVDRPQNDARNGHRAVSRIWRSVMNQSLSYLGSMRIDQVDLSDVHQLEGVPHLLNKSPEAAVELIEAAGFEPILIGSRDQVFNQLPAGGSKNIVGGKVFIQTDMEDRLPDFTGWTRAEVNRYASLLGIRVNFSGEGLVQEQSIEAGTLIRDGDTIRISLSRMGLQGPVSEEADPYGETDPELAEGNGAEIPTDQLPDEADSQDEEAIDLPQPQD